MTGRLPSETGRPRQLSRRRPYPAGPSAGRGPPKRPGSRRARSCRRSCSDSSARLRPRVRRRTRTGSRAGRRGALPEHGPEARATSRPPRRSRGWSGRTRAGSAVLLWLCLYDPHDPYEPPEPYAPRFRGPTLRRRDRVRGRPRGPRSTTRSARMGMRDRTAPRGHQRPRRGPGRARRDAARVLRVPDDALAVPFFARGPGASAGHALAHDRVRLVDVFPTVLDLLGLADPPGPRPGRSLASALAGRPARPTSRSCTRESLVPLLHFGWSDLRVLREDGTSTSRAPRAELYDPRRIPARPRTLPTREPARAEALRKALGARLDAERARAKASGTPGPSRRSCSRSCASATWEAKHRRTRPRRAPTRRDRIEDFRIANDLIREGLTRLHDRDFAGSAERFRAVLARGIESLRCTSPGARGVGPGQHAEAARHFEEAAKRSPRTLPAWMGLARSLLGAGSRPKRARTRRRCRWLPTSGPLRAELGDSCATGDAEGAIRLQTEATRLSPDVAAYWNSLGMTLGGNRRPADAERRVPRGDPARRDQPSLRVQPRPGAARHRDEPAEARPWFEKRRSRSGSAIQPRPRAAAEPQ